MTTLMEPEAPAGMPPGSDPRRATRARGCPGGAPRGGSPCGWPSATLRRHKGRSDPGLRHGRRSRWACWPLAPPVGADRAASTAAILTTAHGYGPGAGPGPPGGPRSSRAPTPTRVGSSDGNRATETTGDPRVRRADGHGSSAERRGGRHASSGAPPSPSARLTMRGSSVGERRVRISGAGRRPARGRPRRPRRGCARAAGARRRTRSSSPRTASTAGMPALGHRHAVRRGHRAHGDASSASPHALSSLGRMPDS